MLQYTLEMKVFLTGADGFIGSHLAELLVKRGHTVKALAMYNSMGTLGWLSELSPDILANIEIHLGDVRDPTQMRSLIAQQDAVINLAALIAIPFSYVAPDLYIDTNIKGTANLLNASRDSGVSRFIQASTSEVYGSAEYVPMDERHPLKGQSPYAASKIGADQMVKAFNSSFDLPTTTVRPFNTFGPRQSTRAVIPSIITQIAAGMKTIKLGALTPTRDFSFVTDTVKGFELALHSASAIGETINLGSGFEISILDTFDLIKSQMSSSAALQVEESRLRPINSEVDRLFSNNNKAMELLNWTPDFAGKEGFAKALDITIDWFSRSENLSKYRAGEYAI